MSRAHRRTRRRDALTQAEIFRPLPPGRGLPETGLPAPTIGLPELPNVAASLTDIRPLREETLEHHGGQLLVPTYDRAEDIIRGQMPRR